MQIASTKYQPHGAAQYQKDGLLKSRLSVCNLSYIIPRQQNDRCARRNSWYSVRAFLLPDELFCDVGRAGRILAVAVRADLLGERIRDRSAADNDLDFVT